MNDSAVRDPLVRSLDAERGLAWMTEAWGLFTARAGLWILLTIVSLGILLVAGIVPLLGTLLSPFASTLVIAGLMLVAAKQHSGGSPEVSELFAVLSHAAFRPLMVLTLLYLALSFALALLAIAVMAVTGGTAAIFGGILGGEEAAVAAGFGTLLLGSLLVIAVMVPIIAMYWFAVPLVLFEGTEPWRAMKASLRATLTNLLPLLVYGLLGLIAVIAGIITLGLGFLVAMPLLLISWFLSYREIFSPAPPPTGIEKL